MTKQQLSLICCIAVACVLFVAAGTQTSSLPSHYDAQNWPLFWTIFDIVFGALALLTGIFLWRGSPYGTMAATATAMLAGTDALLDTLTAHGKDIGNAQHDLVGELFLMGAFLAVAIFQTRRQR